MLVFRYAAFALVATGVNLGLQYACLALLGGPQELPIAIVLGTAAGLATKYVLDKRWIFYDDEGGLRAHGRKFGLYSAMGLFTTAVFWGTETLFALLFHTDFMTLAGGALGLALGYVLKFHLDRRFVFRRVQAI